jgi:hypothetical protein
LSVSASQKLSISSILKVSLRGDVTSKMAEWPNLVEVLLMIDSNMFQPLSCQVVSPVMRYMYHTDSIASGLDIGVRLGISLKGNGRLTLGCIS